MCGIAGIVSLNGRPVALDEVRSMCAAMFHRGPDDDGFYLSVSAALGMRRLSIIDLDSSNGTFLNEDTLEPHEPYQLRDGDDLQMGNLLMHITFQASA